MKHKLYLNIAYIFGIWTFLIYTTLFIGYKILSTEVNPQKTFLEIFKNWDGGHFLGIAQVGYRENFQYAFFPLYPLLIKLVNLFTNNFTISALILSLTSTYFALVFLYKLSLYDFSNNSSKKILIWILIFPTSLYLTLAYSESLFLLLIFLCFYFFRKYLKTNNKKNLYFVIFFSALASLTRLSGVAVGLSLIIWLILNRRFRKNLEIIFSFSGIFLFGIYNFYQSGNFFNFLEAEQYWQRQFSPFGGFFEVIIKIFSTKVVFWDLNWFINLLFLIFGIGMILRSFRFLPKYYSIFGLISVLIPLSSSTLTSFPRFLLPIFPIFFMIELIKNRALKIVYIFLSFLILILFTLAYVGNIWIS